MASGAWLAAVRDWQIRTPQSRTSLPPATTRVTCEIIVIQVLRYLPSTIAVVSCIPIDKFSGYALTRVFDSEQKQQYM